MHFNPTKQRFLVLFTASASISCENHTLVGCKLLLFSSVEKTNHWSDVAPPRQESSSVWLLTHSKNVKELQTVCLGLLTTTNGTLSSKNSQRYSNIKILFFENFQKFIEDFSKKINCKNTTSLINHRSQIAIFVDLSGLGSVWNNYS